MRQGRLRPLARSRPRGCLRQPGHDPFGERYDAIVDTGGNTPVRTLRGALTSRGALAIVGGEGGGAVTGMGRQVRAVLLSPFVRQRLTFILNRERLADLERLRDLVGCGAVAPRVDRTIRSAPLPTRSGVSRQARCRASSPSSHPAMPHRRGTLPSPPERAKASSAPAPCSSRRSRSRSGAGVGSRAGSERSRFELGTLLRCARERPVFGIVRHRAVTQAGSWSLPSPPSRFRRSMNASVCLSSAAGLSQT